MKKFLCIVLTVFILSSCFMVLCFANEPKKLVVFGDSIAWGTGVYNSEEACYARIIADTNGYEYRNFAYNGARSQDVLQQVHSSEGQKELMDADYVFISVGGNDYLQQNLLVLVPEVLVGIDENMNNIEKDLAENFAEIITSIHSFNPDCIIFVNRLYNPEPLLLGYIYGQATARVNRVIDTYASEHPGEIELVDVTGVIENHLECVALDTIHPSAVGNVEIAKVYQQRLYDMGLTEISEPTVNQMGIDELPFTSYILKAILDTFQTVFDKLSFVL